MDKEYFFKTDQLVIWRPSGILDTVKIHEFISFVNECSKQGDPHFCRFIDLTQISGISVSYQDLYPIAKQRIEYYDTTLKKKVRMAILVNNPLSYGMARMYEMLSENPYIDVNIYENADEAARFLEVDKSIISP